MDALHGVLLAIALVASVLAFWFAMRGSVMSARAATEAARAERAESEREAARARIESLLTSLNEQENRAIVLEKDLQAAHAQHESEMRRVQEIASEKVRGAEERERALREEFALIESKMQQSFKALASDVLKGNSAELVRLAGETLGRQVQIGSSDLEQRRQAIEATLRPLVEAVRLTNEKITQLDKDRAQTQTSIHEQVRAMTDASAKLHEETRRLTDALRKPEVRGAYGEMQLRRVAEIAGMTAYCDYAEQQTVDDGSARPDMIVRLPSGRTVIVDAKTNIQAYMDAVQASTPEEQSRHLERFARHVAEQATKLARKEYWKSVEGSPEFVVMFVPGDQFIDAALARQPDLLETAARQGVILASPATLIGLLRAVAVGYKEARLAQAAEELRALGREFHERMATALEPLVALGSDLDRATRNYNRFVGSYESRLQPTLVKFEDSGVRGKKDLPDVVTVNASVRGLQSTNTRQESP